MYAESVCNVKLLTEINNKNKNYNNICWAVNEWSMKLGFMSSALNCFS